MILTLPGLGLHRMQSTRWYPLSGRLDLGDLDSFSAVFPSSPPAPKPGLQKAISKIICRGGRTTSNQLRSWGELSGKWQWVASGSGICPSWHFITVPCRAGSTGQIIQGVQ